MCSLDLSFWVLFGNQKCCPREEYFWESGQYTLLKYTLVTVIAHTHNRQGMNKKWHSVASVGTHSVTNLYFVH